MSITLEPFVASGAAELAAPTAAVRGASAARVVLRFGDALACAVAWGLASGATDVAPAARAAIVAVAVVVTSMGISAGHLDRGHGCGWWTRELALLAQVTGWAAGAVALAALAWAPGVGAGTIVLGACLELSLLGLHRWSFRRWLEQRRRAGDRCREIGIVASADEAARLVRLFADRPELGNRAVAVFGPEAHDAASGAIDLRDDPTTQAVPWLGGARDAVGTAKRLGISGLVVSTASLEAGEVNELVRDAIAVGLHLHLTTAVTGLDIRRFRHSPLAREPFFYVAPPSARRGGDLAKRGIDVGLAAISVLLSSPLLLMAMVAIKLDDRGPVLYHQTRIGRDGRPFRFYKFRTMVPDADDLLAEVTAQNERLGGPLFKIGADPRVTRVGRVLRASSIDELPQLFNVLGGTMSLVGPRPPLPAEAAEFEGELLLRFEVRPGITGLWQVEARDHPSFDLYRDLDLFYIENRTIWLDAVILLTTLPVVLGHATRAFRRGATDTAPLAGAPAST